MTCAVDSGHLASHWRSYGPEQYWPLFRFVFNIKKVILSHVHIYFIGNMRRAENARNVLIAVARIGKKVKRSSLLAKNRDWVDVSAGHLITVLKNVPIQQCALWPLRSERPQGHQQCRKRPVHKTTRRPEIPRKHLHFRTVIILILKQNIHKKVG